MANIKINNQKLSNFSFYIQKIIIITRRLYSLLTSNFLFIKINMHILTGNTFLFACK